MFGGMEPGNAVIVQIMEECKMKIEKNSALLVIDIQQEDFKQMREDNMHDPQWDCIRIHCMEDSPDSDYAQLTYPIKGEYLISKRRYSSFFGTDLEILLKGLHVDTLYLIGGLTDVCIHYTAVDAHQHDYHIKVVTDAVAGSSQEAHAYALRAIQYLQRDAWTTVAEIESIACNGH